MIKLCVDLGATNVKSGLVDDYKIIKTAITPTITDNGRQGVISSLKQAIDCLLTPQVTAICISSAGTIDSERGVVIFATANLPDYTGFDIVSWVKQTYDLPCVALNDGHAALLGEIALNKDLRNKRVVMLTLGSGVGGAYAVNGKLVANEDNNYALFGHLCLVPNGYKCNCGEIGCVEQYLSGRAINRAASKVGIAKDEIFRCYEKDDPNAIAVVNDIRRYLHATLNLVYRTNPFDVCILGGGATDGMGKSFDKITQNLGYDIVKATAGNGAGMLGAYYFGKDIG